MQTQSHININDVDTFMFTVRQSRLLIEKYTYIIILFIM